MDACTQGRCSARLQEAARRWKWNPCWLWYVGVVFVVLLIAAGSFYIDQTNDRRCYSVAIDSISGLDPATDLGRRPTLDLEFNLTFRVASSSLLVGECIEPGMYVEVSYREVSLASSGTVTGRICAGPRNATEHAVVARGAGVVMPGAVLAGLATDMRRGEQIFDVMIRSRTNYDYKWWCGATRVGDPGSLRGKCR